MKTLCKQLFILLFTLGIGCLGARAETEEEEQAKLDKFMESLHFKAGHVVVGDKLAELNLPAEFQYLNSEDAEKVLTQLWGNPDADNTLGMIVPTKAGLTSDDSWAVVISYSEDGYVKDDDANKINYNDLLKKMKEATQEASKEHEKNGYHKVELIGWATPPRYDAVNHKMYWAKELKFGDQEVNTLNYNIRILGRHGVLVLNAVAGMNQLEEIEKMTPAILQLVDFQEGKRYADFNPNVDKIAAYGLAGLVLGGIAAKAGLFKGLIALLLIGKKFIIIGIIAVAGFVKKLFGKKKEDGQ